MERPLPIEAQAAQPAGGRMMRCVSLVIAEFVVPIFTDGSEFHKMTWCEEWFPSYPTSSDMAPGSSRWTTKFHFCTSGLRKSDCTPRNETGAGSVKTLEGYPPVKPFG